MRTVSFITKQNHLLFQYLSMMNITRKISSNLIRNCTSFKPAFTNLLRYTYSTYSKQHHPRGLISRIQYGFASKTVNLPNVADSVTQGKVLEIVKNVGDWVNEDETVAQLETDKVTVEIKAPVAGTVTKFHANVGDNLEVGKPFFDLDPEVEGKKSTGKKQQKAESVKSEPAKEEKQKEKETQKQKPKQTKSEAPKQQPKSTTQTNQQTQAASSKSPLPGSKQISFAFSRSVAERKQTKEPLSSIRVKSAERLKQVQNTYALLTTFQECDVGNTLEIIERHQEGFTKKYGVNLGLLAFFVKASAGAIVENPIVNSIIDGTQLVKRNYVDINVSIATSLGIISPVLKNCNVRSIFDIQRELNEISQKAESGTLGVEYLQNGTFSINNSQVDFSLMSTPILRPLQSALLGVNSVVTKPIAKNGQIVARPTMFVSLTYDHRILDGKDAVVTLKSIKEQIEDPARILIGV